MYAIETYEDTNCIVEVVHLVTAVGLDDTKGSVWLGIGT